MASEPKTLLRRAAKHSAEVRRIARLAESQPIVEAQRWLTRERLWMTDRHLQLCRIPAPTFFEARRAEWLRDQFALIGWSAKLDRGGNVLASFGAEALHPALVVSAHLDTVFAPDRPEEVYAAPDGRLIGPGVSDNGSGLSALLALARLLAESAELHSLAREVLLVANVGEEGEGNLSGMQYLCRQSLDTSQITAFIVVDGPSTEHITAQALASKRFEISFNGPGGHSWNDYGTPNPVHAVSDLVSDFVHTAQARVASERKNRCSFNFGVMEGGSSINSIPSNARTKLDLRSENLELLEEFASMLPAAVERSLERENRPSPKPRLTAKIRELGARPGGKLPDDSPLLGAIQAIDAHLQIRSRVGCASTDANVPLSMGLPAISIGAGGHGGGAHTSAEWYQADGRERGLRRILLLLAALSSDASGQNVPDSAATR